MKVLSHRRSRARAVAGLVAVLLGLSVYIAQPSSAFVFILPAPSFLDTSTVGQTFPASLGVGNFSTPPESVTFPVLTIQQLNLVPACSTSGNDCPGGVESGVVSLSATGVGVSGPASCIGTWTITPIAPAGTFRFTPPGGEATLLLATGNVCVINFTATSLRVPTVDVAPSPGVQTRQLATASASAPGLSTVRNSGTDQTTITQATPGLTTAAAQSSPTAPGTTTDTATLSPPPPPSSGAGAPPTGTITWNLYGDAACAGASLFTQTLPVNAGFASYGPTNPAPINAPGTYRWVASYSGDANYNAVGPTACGDPAETVSFASAQPAITTIATPPSSLGGTSTDAATLTAPPGVTVPPAPAPTGTITFRLYGPNNPTCDPAGPIHSTSTVPVNHFGAPAYSSAASGPVVTPGTYHWTAVYSGDANYPSAGPTACLDPAETFVVASAQPAITTVATPPASLGGTSTDSATLAGPAGVTVPPAPAPTGTITFRLYGPNNPTCDPAGPIHSTSTVPVNLFGAPAYSSAASGPVVTPGTYHWTAVYSGDANYIGAGPTACLDPAETFVVASAQPAITTVATPPASLGGTSTDSATLAGPAGVTVPPAPAPTGTITFRLFGPGNPTCDPIGAVHSTSTVPVDHFGGSAFSSAASGPVVAPGTYHWTAAYSGDANYGPAGPTACLDPAETFVVNQASVTLVTAATSAAAVGGSISDTATVTGIAGLPAPTGTVTFTLFTTPTCSGAPVFTSANRPLSGGPSATATSEAFTVPAEATYRWIASYSGDATYLPVTGACNDPNEVSVVATPPSITVTKSATPPTRPEPGGSFTFSVAVTNTSAPLDPVTIQTITDDVYGNLAIRAGSTCGGLIGAVLAPGQSTAPCTFTGTFNGSGGASQTDIVTVTVVDDEGQTASNAGSATVSLTDAPPAIVVIKDAAPATKPAPGGQFSFRVLIRNVSGSSDPITIQAISDDIYGNLAGRPLSNCGFIIGAVVAPGATTGCTFAATFTGAPGASQTDRVTVVVVDNEGTPAVGSDDATVSIAGVPSPTSTTSSSTTTSSSSSTTTSTSTTSTTQPPTSTSSTSSTTSTSTSTSTVPASTTSTTVGPPRCNGLVATIVGTPGNDSITGTAGRDVIVGMGGDDRIFGLGDDDMICGGDGNDTIFGGDGADLVLGGNGNDTLSGDAGNDRILGEAGRDIIVGRDGDDALDGGADVDVCSGDAGGDTATACESVLSVP